MQMLSYVFMALSLGLMALAVHRLGFAFLCSFKEAKAKEEKDRLDVLLLKKKLEIEQIKYATQKSVSENTWSNLRKFQVDQLIKEAGDVTSVYLKPHDKKPLPPYKPGQFLTFGLKIPGAEKVVTRCYSLSDRFTPDYYRISVKKVPPPPDKQGVPPGLSSTYFNEIVKVGDIIDVRAPAGGFHLDPFEHHPTVFIAGGIGITPVYSMLRSVLEHNPARETWMFYGIRNSPSYVFKEELEKMRREFPNFKLVVVNGNPEATEKEGVHFDKKGHLTVALMKATLPNMNYTFYLCGPPPMMTTVVKDLEEAKVPSDKINFEAFGPASVKKTSTAAAPSSGPEIKVSFSRSNKSISWTNQLGSILELAEANQVNLASGCRAGNCGTCVVAIRSGEVQYLKPPSFETEKGTCLACCAIPKGPVLELDV